MQIYQVERNDFCPCGSERKYKKCCLPAVEEATRAVGRAVGPNLTAHGKEVVNTLGFICGLKWDEGARPPEFERVGRLLKEAWEEEEEAMEEPGGERLDGISSRFAKLLREKPCLRSVRIPPDFLLEIEAHQETDEELKQCIEGVVSGLADDEDFVYSSIVDLAYSLHFDSFSDEELKALFTGLGWLVGKDTRYGFIEVVLSVTMEEFEEAMEKIEAFESSADEEDEAAVRELMDFLQENTVFGEYFYTKLLKDTVPAMRAIEEGKINLVLPLYAVLRGIYKYINEVLANLPRAFIKKVIDEDLFRFDWIGACLWEDGEAKYFLPEIFRVLSEHAGQEEDKSLAMALERLLFASQVGVVINNPDLIERLYLLCLYKFIDDMLTTLPGTEMNFNGLEDLLDEEKVARYAESLKEKGLEKEANYVLEQFRTLGHEAKEKYDAGIAGMVKWRPKFAKAGTVEER